jgi:hypothetical protein
MPHSALCYLNQPLKYISSVQVTVVVDIDILKWERRVRKMESEKTSGTEEAPFFDSATHRYCLMASMQHLVGLEDEPSVLQDGQQQLDGQRLGAQLVRLTETTFP